MFLYIKLFPTLPRQVSFRAGGRILSATQRHPKTSKSRDVHDWRASWPA
jgi:hypothetical protein